MSSPSVSVVEWHRAMPDESELRFAARTRQWPGSVRLLGFPVGFGLGPLFLLLRGEPLTGAVAAFFWIAVGLSATSVAVMLALLWLRRGPDFGIGDAGVWLRPSPWRRRAGFVPFGRLRDVEVDALSEPGDRLIGALVRLDTEAGPFPRRWRFIACDRTGYEGLARAAASITLLTGGRDDPGDHRTR